MTTEKHLIPHGESPFSHDPFIGRLLRPGQDFIGSDDFLSFADAVELIRSSGKSVILNIGDSSTAGWDTRVTVENQQRRQASQPLLSALFRYPTFADLLRETVGDKYVVLNAGVPGHTSINVLRRLQDLLRKFDSAGIKIAIVNIYIGNNDCQWERNTEDKHTLRSSLQTPVFVDKLRARLRKPDHDNIRLRTNARDFRKNVRDILNACRMHGALPVLIEPQTPLLWEPGKRFVKDAYPVDETMPGGPMVLAALAKAQELWSGALDMEPSDARIEQLEQAREMDFVVPRLKSSYRRILNDAARELETPVIRTSIPPDADESEYFVDYCHPIGPANAAIAEQLHEVVNRYEQGQLKLSAYQPSLLVRFLDSRFMDGVARLVTRSGSRGDKKSQQHDDIYTLY